MGKWGPRTSDGSKFSTPAMNLQEERKGALFHLYQNQISSVHCEVKRRRGAWQLRLAFLFRGVFRGVAGTTEALLMDISGGARSKGSSSLAKLKSIGIPLATVSVWKSSSMFLNRMSAGIRHLFCLHTSDLQIPPILLQVLWPTHHPIHRCPARQNGGRNCHLK